MHVPNVTDPKRIDMDKSETSDFEELAAHFSNANRLSMQVVIDMGYRAAVREGLARGEFSESDIETISIDQLMVLEEQENQRMPSMGIYKKRHLGLRLIAWIPNGRKLQSCYSGEAGDWVRPGPVRQCVERGLGGKTPR